jgi:hypothetical protein
VGVYPLVCVDFDLNFLFDVVVLLILCNHMCNICCTGNRCCKLHIIVKSLNIMLYESNLLFTCSYLITCYILSLAPNGVFVRLCDVQLKKVLIHLVICVWCL